MNNLIIPPQAITLIKKLENYIDHVSKDQAGRLNAGYGTLVFDKPLGTMIIQQWADDMLEVKCTRNLAYLSHAIDITVLNSNQLSALLSFVYNTGTLGQTLCSELKEFKYDLVPAAMRMWVWITDPVTNVKRVSQGLVNRREAEIKMWNTPIVSEVGTET